VKNPSITPLSRLPVPPVPAATPFFKSLWACCCCIIRYGVDSVSSTALACALFEVVLCLAWPEEEEAEVWSLAVGASLASLLAYEVI